MELASVGLKAGDVVSIIIRRFDEREKKQPKQDESCRRSLNVFYKERGREICLPRSPVPEDLRLPATLIHQSHDQ